MLFTGTASRCVCLACFAVFAGVACLVIPARIVLFVFNVQLINSGQSVLTSVAANLANTGVAKKGETGEASANVE